MVDALATFINRVGVVNVANDLGSGLLGKMPEHFAENWHGHILSAARTCLKNDGQSGFVCRFDEGAGFFPAEYNKPHDRAALAHGRQEYIVERCDRHLNFAIMSLMPGIVSI